MKEIQQALNLKDNMAEAVNVLVNLGGVELKKPLFVVESIGPDTVELVTYQNVVNLIYAINFGSDLRKNVFYIGTDEAKATEVLVVMEKAFNKVDKLRQ